MSFADESVSEVLRPLSIEMCVLVGSLFNFVLLLLHLCDIDTGRI